jgi:hypothetical protein
MTEACSEMQGVGLAPLWYFEILYFIKFKKKQNQLKQN